MKSESVNIPLKDQQISGLFYLPDNCKAIIVLGHGAGAGMKHPFMEQLAQNLATCSIGSLRYNFPYMEQGRRSPGSPRIAQAAVRAAVIMAGELAKENNLPSETPLFAGGKSYGGRMTSQEQSEKPLAGVKGLVFYGFPLHAPGRPGSQRGDHLRSIKVPMLFLQGTRDKLADLTLLEPLTEELAGNATLIKIEGADHSFNLLKSADQDTDTARMELAEKTSIWCSGLN